VLLVSCCQDDEEQTAGVLSADTALFYRPTVASATLTTCN